MKKILLIASLVTCHFSFLHAQADMRVNANGDYIGPTANFPSGKLKVGGVSVVPGGTVPTGTGFRHVTTGAEDSAAKLVTDADVSGTANIAESKVANLLADLAAKLASVPTGKTIWVDADNGSDSTGLRGRLDKPFLTIAQAITVAQSGDTVRVLPGTFTPSAPLILPAGVNLVCSGIDVTIINSAVPSTTGPVVSAGGSSVIADLTINGTLPANTGYQRPLGCASAATGIVLLNVKVTGDSDALQMNSSATGTFLRAYNCYFAAKIDSVQVQRGTAEFYDCIAISTGPSLGGTYTGALSAISTGTNIGKIYWLGGYASSDGGSTTNSVFEVRGNTAGGLIETGNTLVHLGASAAANYVFNASVGSISYFNIARDDGGILASAGTLNYIGRALLKDLNLFDLPNPAIARTNLALGDSATKNVGTAAGTVAAGDDSRFANDRTANALRTLTAHFIDNATDPTDQQVLYFDNASGKYKFKTLATAGVDDTAFAPSWNGVTASAPSKNAVYDWAHAIDPNDNGRIASTEIQDFSTTGPNSTGQILIYNASTGKAEWGDPYVSGPTAHDAVGTSTNPVATGGYASAAAPTDVSADGDIVRDWNLRNGARAVQLVDSGTLYGAAKESGGNLASIKTNTDTIAGAVSASKVATKSADGDHATIGSTTDAAAADANGSVNAHVREVAKDASTIAGAVSSNKVATKSADGDHVTMGAKTDNKSTATDTTAVSAISLLKEISAMLQAPAAQPITNGTQIVDTAPGDTGQNSLVTSGARKEVTFTTTTAQAVASTDASNYRWVSVQITAQGGSSTVTFQGSNDNSSWQSLALLQSSATGNTQSVTNQTGNGIWTGPLPTRYFRLNVTGIVSGTTSGVVEFFATPVSLFGNLNNVNQGGNWTMQPGNTANTTPWLTSQTPATSGGLSIYRLLSAATTNGNNIKASAGQIYGWYLYNTAASAKFVKLYNKASAPTVGTDTPVMTIPLPATSGANVFTDSGITFATGISIAITGAVGDSDTTAVAANDVIVNFLYK